MQSNINNANAGIQGINAQGQQQILGGILSGAGSAMGMPAASGGKVRQSQIGNNPPRIMMADAGVVPAVKDMGIGGDPSQMKEESERKASFAPVNLQSGVSDFGKGLVSALKGKGGTTGKPEEFTPPVTPRDFQNPYSSYNATLGEEKFGRPNFSIGSAPATFTEDVVNATPIPAYETEMPKAAPYQSMFGAPQFADGGRVWETVRRGDNQAPMTNEEYRKRNDEMIEHSKELKKQAMQRETSSRERAGTSMVTPMTKEEALHRYVESQYPDSYAKGGKVPALLSPGEKYLTPEQAHKVLKGEENPMKGKTIPGQAKVKGDHLANDTVPAMLDEGGCVIPRSVMQSDKPMANAIKFVHEHMRKMAKGGKVGNKNQIKQPEMVPVEVQKEILNRPHFIFSAANPAVKPDVNASPDEVIELLQSQGYPVEQAKGKYGAEEPSIIVHNVSPKQVSSLMKLAKQLGQESAIFSVGGKHEAHYLNGQNEGMIARGEGTEVHDKEPEDFYTKTPNGLIFSHNINWDNLEPRRPSGDRADHRQIQALKKAGFSDEEISMMLSRNDGTPS
jgi:hypothetical protein